MSHALGGSGMQGFLVLVAGLIVTGMFRSGQAPLPAVIALVAVVSLIVVIATSAVRLVDGAVVIGTILWPHRVEVERIVAVSAGLVGWGRSEYEGVLLHLDSGREVPLSASLFIGDDRRGEWMRALKEHCALG